MKFQRNPELDTIRERYKKEYDEVFDRLVKTTDPKEKKRLQAKEKRLHLRTAEFIRDNIFYFLQKRRDHFQTMENHGTFGDRLGFAPEPAKEDLRRKNRFTMVGRNRVPYELTKPGR